MGEWMDRRVKQQWAQFLIQETHTILIMFPEGSYYQPIYPLVKVGAAISNGRLAGIAYLHSLMN